MTGRSLGPGQPAVARGHMGVFPSGHTATAGVCLALAVLLLAPGLPARTRRAVLAVMAALRLVGLGSAGRRGNSGAGSDAVAGEVAAGTREVTDDSARA